MFLKKGTMGMNNLEWHEEKRKIKDLHDYTKNPRRINKKEFNDLVRSIKEDGYHGRIMVDTYGTIIGGHQRKKALLESGFKSSDCIEVLVPNRELTEEEFKRLNIRDNLPYGEFDMDMLANEYEESELVDWGLGGSITIDEELPTDAVIPKKKKTCPECGAEL